MRIWNLQRRIVVEPDGDLELVIYLGADGRPLAAQWLLSQTGKGVAWVPIREA